MTKTIRFDLRNPRTKRLSRLPEGVDGDKSLMMWKELCRTGDYVADGEKHVIDNAFFTRMVDSFNTRKAKGIEVPCPIGHTHDPEEKRGRVVYLETRPNADGGTSLWGIIEFIDKEAKEALRHSDVSIDAPVETTDGDGDSYRFALEHVAFTDYPVVPGMEGFSDVSFSIVKENEGSRGKSEKPRNDFADEFTLDALIAKMGLTDDFTSPSDVYKSIWRKFSELKGTENASETEKEEAMARKKKFSEEEIEDREKEFDEEEENEKEMSRRSRKKKSKKFSDDEEDEEKAFDNGGDEDDEEDAEFEDDEDDAEFEDDEEEDSKELSRKKKGKRFSRNGADFQLMKENRMMKIDGMRRDGYITAAQSQAMKARFCSDAHISFSLKRNSNRDFNETCAILKAGMRQDYMEHTGMQGISFGRHEMVDRERSLADEMESRFQKKK